MPLSDPRLRTAGRGPVSTKKGRQMPPSFYLEEHYIRTNLSQTKMC